MRNWHSGKNIFHHEKSNNMTLRTVTDNDKDNVIQQGSRHEFSQARTSKVLGLASLQSGALEDLANEGGPAPVF